MAKLRWEGSGARYRWAHPRLCGWVDPAKPGWGIHELELDGRQVPWQILGVRWCTRAEVLGGSNGCKILDDPVGRGGCVLRDCWSCGSDLLAEFVPEFGEDASLTIRWRLTVGTSSSGENSLGVDVVFSLQTLESSCYQSLCLTSLLPGCWQLFVPAGQGELQPVSVGTQEQLPPSGSIVAEIVPGCCWYHEVVHPDDLESWGILPAQAGGRFDSQAEKQPSDPSEVYGNVVRTWYRVFSAPVEKGIIFRARMWAIFYWEVFNRKLLQQTWEEIFPGLPLSD